MSMRWAVIAVFVAGAAACTPSASHPGPRQTASDTTTATSPTRGVVAGKLLMVGGPYPGIHRGLAGTIVVHSRTQSGPVIATVVAHVGGLFRAELPPGLYILVGRSPSLSGLVCVSERRVAVEAGRSVKVLVVCPVP